MSLLLVPNQRTHSKIIIIINKRERIDNYARSNARHADSEF